MGIHTQIRDPIPREPVDLFFDPTYASDASDGASDCKSPTDSSLPIPAIVNARLSPGQDSVPTGTRVFILSLEAETATLWVTDPAPRRLGQIIGPEGQQIARACQTAVSSLSGIVVPGVARGRNDELRVQIRGA